MKLIVPALLVSVLAAPAFADTALAPAEKVTYICYYNTNGKFVSAKPAPEGLIARNKFETTGRGGDQAWAYSIKSTDGSDCPKRVSN